MDPKSASALQQNIVHQVGIMNALAIAHYAALLLACGVKRPTIRVISVAA